MKMNMKNKMILGGVLLVVFVGLQLNGATGNTVHIILNVLFFTLVVLHLVVNRTVIKNIFKNISKFNKGRLVIYVLLLVAFIGALCSGLVLSELFFGQLNDADATTGHFRHGLATRVMIVMVAAHLISNNKKIKNFFGKRP
jgi:cytochrome c oxidase assembly factor CtaG